MSNTYQPTKMGKLLYNATINSAKFLMKHLWLYYILIFTWGSLMTIPGLLISGILICCGKKPYRFGPTWFFSIGKGWGGVELGLPFIKDGSSTRLSLYEHEMGHSIQNAIFGPFAIFISFIPSAFRYWYREIVFYNNGALPVTNYDDIWFEASATDGGKIMHDILLERNQWKDKIEEEQKIIKK